MSEQPDSPWEAFLLMCYTAAGRVNNLCRSFAALPPFAKFLVMVAVILVLAAAIKLGILPAGHGAHAPRMR